MNFIARIAFTCVALSLPCSALAITLDDAKAQGLVGEESTGYIAAVQSPSSGDVAALVSQVNGQRKEKYAEIAKKNGTTVAAVEALAGRKALENTAAGGYVKSGTGGWSKK